MLIKEAEKITGGLSAPSKMPCYSYNLPAQECKTGAKLRPQIGSVCHGCYALKGNYTRYKAVGIAMYRRLDALSNPQWVEAMVTLVNRGDYFRWHDSGDIQNMAHLIKIVAVAMLTPNVKHWIPTREYKIVGDFRKAGGIVPANLSIRLSAPMIDGHFPDKTGLSSMVISQAPLPDNTVLCDASHTMENGQKVKTITKENKKLLGHCGDCRACWDVSSIRTAYPKH